MRGSLALALVLTAFSLSAQERELDAATTRDLDFALTPRTAKLSGDASVIPIEIAIPADELQFVEEGGVLAATFSVRAEARGQTTRLDEPQRITAPRGTTPAGAVTRRFDVHVERGTTTIDVVLRDENAQREARRTLAIDGHEVHLVDVADVRAADALWRDALDRAQREHKPIVVFFETRPCSRCRTFASATLPHPAIQRRLPPVVVVTLPAQAGEAARQWQSADAGVAFFDRRGVLRARWPIVPDTTDFGIILDSVAAVANDFERAAQLFDANDPGAAELAVANGFGRLGRIADARAALARAQALQDRATQQAALVIGAIFDANEGRVADALTLLQPLAASAVNAQIAADAWLAIGALQRARGANDAAARAFTAALEHLDPNAPRAADARQALDELRNGMRVAGAVRVLPPSRQVVSGRQLVRTHVGSPAVARVAFSIDGKEAARVTRPPFSATLDFGDVPERHVIRAVAVDRKGRAIGRDERAVNDAGETFWLHFVSPREGPADGSKVHVAMNLRVPPTQTLRRLVVSWNDAERAVLQAPPWETDVAIHNGEVGVLRAVAELNDGRTSEDAVLLNAGGAAGRADVQLVELRMTIAGRDGNASAVTAQDIVVREGTRSRRVESIASAGETPLTIGLLIDVSASMQASLLDVQEAAIGFLESILGPRDRAFVITFDTRARLVQPATSDVAQLRRQIMTLRPDGLTSIHDAMVLGLLQFEGVKGRRAMIVFTDGLDITSEYKVADVRELARRVYVPIHVIASTPGTAARLRASSEPPKAERRLDAPNAELMSIARATGGSAQTLDNLAELPRLYAQIESALRAQLLAFVRTDPGTRANEWRPVTVHVNGRKDAEVFAPEGYYAPW
ncbi:MAG: VWA domain-containing protein [Acidobacteria bacterium]|nr:VWA domain-containing protein [Acidobacteriota bacterium]MBV9476286.1 VWA domain-containing protein [Acidobacteriota bacterium]